MGNRIGRDTVSSQLVNMFGLDRGARQQVAQTTTQQGRPQGTVLRLYRQVIDAHHNNRVQDKDLTEKHDFRSFSTSNP
jgi:hypothetical protein